MTDDKKPREFWIYEDTDEFGNDYTSVFLKEPDRHLVTCHVIEYEAYQAALDREDALLAEIKEIGEDARSAILRKAMLGEYDPSFEVVVSLLEKRCEKAIEENRKQKEKV
jgi:hypothetical protein